ncbi:MAG: CHASE domain-containing protein, partial [bacterium]
VWPAGERDVYSTIVFLEPLAGRNLRAFGYDMLTEPVRRAAMETARDEDQATLSGKVKLVQETGENVQAGILMYAPVYRMGAAHATVAERRAAIVGWVYSPYRMNDLMEGILDQGRLVNRKQLHLQIHDGAAAAPTALLYDSGQAESQTHWTRQVSVDSSGRQWLLTIEKPGVAASSGYGDVWMTLGAGGCICLLLAGLVFSLVNIHTGARRLAMRLTHDLQETTYRLSLAVQAGGVGIWDYDVAKNRLVWDEQMFRLYGITREMFGGAYEAWQAGLHPEDRQRGDAEIQLALQNAKDFDTEFRVLWPDGAIHNIRALATVERDAAGNPVLECMCGNILSGRFDPAKPFFTAHGSFWTNGTTTLLAGTTGADRLTRTRNRCNRDGYESVALVPLRVDAQLLGLIQFNDHRPDRFTPEQITRFEDMADRLAMTLLRRQDADALRASEFQYRSLYENMTDGFALHEIICAPDGTPVNYRFLTVNPAFERLTGLKGAAIVGQTVLDVLPGTERCWIDAYGKVALTGEPAFFEDYTAALNKSFEVRAFRPAKNQFACVFFDVTDRKRAEAEQQKMQKLQSIGTLAGGIAHDFNNIMVGLFGNLSLAKEELAHDHPGYLLLAEAEKSMNRAVRLTKQLLTFAKGGDPIKENVSLGTLVEEIARFDLAGSAVKLVYQQAPELWLAVVDKGQMQQVISNLTINARQAMPEGGSLYITLDNADLSATAMPGLRPGKYVQLTVRDEGVGIAPEHLNRIFDPYFTTKQAGSGLGLAVTYSIINKHGGHLVVASELGRGSTFTLYLPASESSLRAADAPPAAVAPTLKRPANILVMDDEVTVRQIVARILGRSGFSVTTAADGHEAIQLYQQAMADGAPFDAVILDLTVPGGLGGKETIKQLLALDPQAKAIVSSGYADDPVMANYADYGFQGIAVKPYTPNELRTVLARILK